MESFARRAVRAAITDLVDTAATTFDDEERHPLAGRIDDLLGSLPWVAHAGSRVRDQGHVLHVESFVVPIDRLPEEVGGGRSRQSERSS